MFSFLFSFLTTLINSALTSFAALICHHISRLKNKLATNCTNYYADFNARTTTLPSFLVIPIVLFRCSSLKRATHCVFLPRDRSDSFRDFGLYTYCHYAQI